MRPFTSQFLVLAMAFIAQPQEQAIVREQQDLSVAGVTEHWRLEWLGSPAPTCRPQDAGWGTCPCDAFQYGEIGGLDLVRTVRGGIEDRLSLTPLFADHHSPATWAGLTAATLSRAPHGAKAMIFGDYDHDGRATEFVLRVGYVACGHDEAVLIGISRAQPSLHAFVSVAHPERPLVLDTQLWESLLHSDGKTTAVEWACGDHGAEEQVEVNIQATPKGLDVTELVYWCTEQGARGALKTRAPR
jgi:hypothetical protein